MTDDTVSGVVVRLIEVLEASGEVYAFGGAIALAAWSEPRATADVDVVLWVRDEPEDIDRVIDLVGSAGVAIDRGTAHALVRSRGMFDGMAGVVRVDVFVPSIPFYVEAEARRVATTIAGKATWVHSAEVLSVFKLLFFRPKDLIDVERMLQVQGASFDRGFVHTALTEMLGEDDRITKWDELCQRNPV
ncbi:MAG: hypothetical protein OXU20_24895 [Myxococcales bacterium]|nr:hypothetical protein [Myxococcales bacterium]